MKFKHFIAALFVAAAIFSFSYKGNAQERKADSLICDETNFKPGKNNFTIVTTNEKVFEQLRGKFEEEIKSYTVRYIYDRHGKSKNYSIVFYNEREKEITDFLAD